MASRRLWHAVPAVSTWVRVAPWLAVVALLAGGMQAAEAQAPRPQLDLSAPRQVNVGEPVQLTLTVRNAADIAAYETNVMFDTSVAEFDGLRQRQNDLKSLGRDVGPLGPVSIANGMSIGLYSCPVAQCTQRTVGARQDRGGRGTVRLATVGLVARAPGTLEIRLTGTTFADASGKLVTVDNAEQTVRVQIGAAGDGPLHSVPGAAPQRVARQAARAGGGSADVTSDQVVDHADSADAAEAWSRAREQGAVCGSAIDPHIDVNGDGCLDILDLQSIAANYSPPQTVRASAAPQPQAQVQAQAVGTLATTLTVNSTGDELDLAPGDGVCTHHRRAPARCGRLSRRRTPRAGPTRSTSRYPLGGVKTINLSRPLPALNDLTGGTLINGYTQQGASPNTDPRISNAHIMVEIRGLGAGSFQNGLTINSPNNEVRGLAIFNWCDSVRLDTSGASSNIVAGNFLGTDAAASFFAPVKVQNCVGAGIRQGAADNLIGGTAPADRNVISGNAHSGVALFQEGTERNRILNNLIGLSPQGDRSVQNWGQGIDINSVASHNQIGGTASGEHNVVSGNVEYGVELSHDTLTVGNEVVGNFIGTNVTGDGGTPALRNGQSGVHVEDGVNSNTVSDNVIGNNTFYGVLVAGYAPDRQSHREQLHRRLPRWAQHCQWRRWCRGQLAR